MSINSREVTATIAGAIIGSIAGYLFFTERGRRIRQQIEPALEDLAREVTSFRSTIQNASEIAADGWKVLSETLNETASAPRFPGRQTSPF